MWYYYFIAGVVCGMIPVWLVCSYIDRRNARARRLAEMRRIERRPAIAPPEDSLRVTRHPDQPRKHARVTVAHMSQRRKGWN